MADETRRGEQLLAEFTDLYIEKLFYFSLKKTGSRQEAEDLAAEIALEVVSSLRRGLIPENFQAWFWRLAHNHSVDWLNTRNRHRSRHAESSLEDLALPDDAPQTLDTLIHDETLAALRRELAFISSEYRDIVVAYYIKGRSVGEIARDTGLAEGTVKSRLYYARKRLKEGMEMAREFGRLSYDPGRLRWYMGGCSGLKNEPWCYLERKLAQNILLAAYRKPSTAEELAIEVGVALPYIEEELAALTEATLMRQNGRFYETGFPIISSNTQMKIQSHMSGLAPDIAEGIIDALEYNTAWYNAECPGWHAGFQPWEDMKWALLMQHLEWVRNEIRAEKCSHPEEQAGTGARLFTQRPNRGEWDVVGLENCQTPFVAIGVHYAGLADAPQIRFKQYKFPYRNIASKTPHLLTQYDVQVFRKILEDDTEGIPESALQELMKYGYLRRVEGRYEPTFGVLYSDRSKPMPPEVRAELDRRLQRAKTLMIRHWEYCSEQIVEDMPEFLKKDTHQLEFVSTIVADVKEAVFKQAIKTGYFTYEDGDENRALGALLII